MVTTLVLTLALHGVPIDGIVVRDGGYRIGPAGWKATEINCGRNMTCVQSGNMVTLNATASDGGSFTQIALDAGYWVAWADPNLTAEKNLGALATGLVINTAGTPSTYTGSSCSTHNWATAASASGALTCAQPAFTDLSGSPLAGGSNPQVQYNNSGVLGGSTKVESDGTRMLLVNEAAEPSAPGTSDRTQLIAYALDSGFPTFLQTQDYSFGVPVPVGLLGANFFPGSQTWSAQCHILEQWNTNTVATNIGSSQNLISNGTLGSIAYDGTTAKGNYRLVSITSSIVTKSAASEHSNWAHTSRGQISGHGGFIWWTRGYIMSAAISQQAMFGLSANTSDIAGAGINSTNNTDAVYFGCDSYDSNLSICSNDNVGRASCSSLGSSFPCTTSGAGYDFWLAAPPNASYILWYINRLDSAATLSGRLTTDLPRNTVQMSAHAWLNNGPDSGEHTASVLHFGGMCWWDNW